MSRRNDDDHGGGSGWRFTWRIDRLQKLHKLGRAFGLTEDSQRRDDADDQASETSNPASEQCHTP